MSKLQQFKTDAWGSFYHLCIVHPYALMRHLWPVWYYISNADARRRFQENSPQLDEVQKRIISDFKRFGVATTHCDELFPGQNLLPELQRYTQTLADKAEVKNNKQFLRFLWDAVPELDIGRNPFLDITLGHRVLDMINSYMGMYAKLYFFTLNITDPVSAGAKPVQSQRWHRDSDDKLVPKIFIYLNDVDEEAGPFMCVKESHYGGKWRGLFRQRPPHGSRAPYGKVEEIVPQKDIKVCTGRAGTIVFFDTSGLHKGGYATKKERLMFTGIYASSASYKYTYHRGFRYPENFAEIRTGAHLSSEAAYAIELPQPSRFFRFINRLGKPWVEKDY
ncbi:MAG: phytanoyl-CoA dioxygenase family protein [Candidatus Sungbacteria bacterium]|nr:phytanoyl-CoA dioxygenase family protein [bacterium]MDZ4260459.1 phytanoyl-CoA dioxygenase family protein [Candidatus Sungbacteria bacterium]